MAPGISIANIDSGMLEVEVTSYGVALGSYVLEGGVLRWEGLGGHKAPFDPADRYEIDGVYLSRPIRASDRMEDGWIVPEDDPERWLRRVPGYYAMRGHLTAKIVVDT